MLIERSQQGRSVSVRKVTKHTRRLNSRTDGGLGGIGNRIRVHYGKTSTLPEYLLNILSDKDDVTIRASRLAPDAKLSNAGSTRKARVSDRTLADILCLKGRVKVALRKFPTYVAYSKRGLTTRANAFNFILSTGVVY